MWPDHIPRPSKQLEDFLRGKTPLDEVPASIRSWAHSQIDNAACLIIAAPDKGTRRNMLGRIPKNVRPLVEEQVKKYWPHRHEVGL